jgi:hypothetical protein
MSCDHFSANYAFFISYFEKSHFFVNSFQVKIKLNTRHAQLATGTHAEHTLCSREDHSKQSAALSHRSRIRRGEEDTKSRQPPHLGPLVRLHIAGCHTSSLIGSAPTRCCKLGPAAARHRQHAGLAPPPRLTPALCLPPASGFRRPLAPAKISLHSRPPASHTLRVPQLFSVTFGLVWL